MAEQPQDLYGWVSFLSRAEIPVLKRTARELAQLQENEDRLNARAVAAVITQDPMMTVRLLRYLQEHKGRSQLHELVQIEQALMMMGLNTFFRVLPPQPLAEDMLQEHPEAMLQLLRTVHRSQRGARYAFDWALLLHDLHAEEVRIAALLSYLAEMLMWCFNPVAMLKIRALQEADQTLRSSSAQEQVLGFIGINLQRELTTGWRLPGLLLDLMEPVHAEQKRVRNVLCAINLARHSANGWDDAALPDDYRDIGELLRMEPEGVMALVGAQPEETGEEVLQLKTDDIPDTRQT